MSFKVFPYKQGSASAKTLAEALQGKVLKIHGSKYRPKRGDFVINWGAGDVPDFTPATTLNSGGRVRAAANKLTALKAFERAGVRVPPFVETKGDAEDNLTFPVVCRTKLTGHSGDGIVIAETKQELVNAPLYTQYIKKKDEYRVHVFKDRPFFIQRKARKLDVEEPNWQVRNLAGGFVFVEVNEDEVPKDVLDQAIKGVDALGLDFGGVDVMWNERERQAYVLEVNTACGLEERTADRYRNEVLHFVEGKG